MGRGKVAPSKARRSKAVRMKIEGASYAEIKVTCGYNSIKYTRAEVREGLRQYWITDEEEKRQAISQAAGRLEVAQRVAMKLMLDDTTEPRDVAKLMDSLTKLQQRQSQLQALDIQPMPDKDENAVDMWLIQIGGNVETPPELSDEDDDEDDGAEDLEDEDAA